MVPERYVDNNQKRTIYDKEDRANFDAVCREQIRDATGTGAAGATALQSPPIASERTRRMRVGIGCGSYA